MRADWPAADIVPADHHTLARRIFDPLDTRSDAPLAVVLKGTNLQLQVWTALLRLPEGTAVSYGDMAQRVGTPTTVRAVANTIAANRVGFLVPCHRVLARTARSAATPGVPNASGRCWHANRQ